MDDLRVGYAIAARESHCERVNVDGLFVLAHRTQHLEDPVCEFRELLGLSLMPRHRRTKLSLFGMRGWHCANTEEPADHRSPPTTEAHEEGIELHMATD